MDYILAIATLAYFSARRAQISVFKPTDFPGMDQNEMRRWFKLAKLAANSFALVLVAYVVAIVSVIYLGQARSVNTTHLGLPFLIGLSIALVP